MQHDAARTPSYNTSIDYPDDTFCSEAIGRPTLRMSIVDVSWGKAEYMGDQRGHVSFMFKDANNSFLLDYLAAAIFWSGGLRSPGNSVRGI